MSNLFLDNWTYLKVELNALERLLLMAVARQRKDMKEVERVAQTKADRATSHWWKGMVSLEGIGYDVPPERRPSSNSEKISLQQQLQTRIQASQRQGIHLGLPMVCDRLKLSPFEKNVILLGLAPEVHRRYGQLYGFLQTGKDCFELPKVDLALRLFCRTDQEWRAARSQLLSSSPLIQSGLLEPWETEAAPLLQRSIQLRDEFVNFLLEEDSTRHPLEQLISKPNKSEVQSFSSSTPVSTFSQLVLPESLLETLTHLRDRIKFAEQVDQVWGFGEKPGVIALLIGASGTGKTMAVEAIAHSLSEPMTSIDLALLTSQPQDHLIQQLESEAPKILEIQSAEQWFQRSSSAAISAFLEHRRSLKALTFLSLGYQIGIPAKLRLRLDFTLIFPKPNADQRSRLWKNAFPPQTSLDPMIDWQELGRKFSLTGRQIQEKARSAAFCAAATNSNRIAIEHILQAIALKGST